MEMVKCSKCGRPTPGVATMAAMGVPTVCRECSMAEFEEKAKALRAAILKALPEVHVGDNMGAGLELIEGHKSLKDLLAYARWAVKEGKPTIEVRMNLVHDIFQIPVYLKDDTFLPRTSGYAKRFPEFAKV